MRLTLRSRLPSPDPPDQANHGNDGAYGEREHPQAAPVHEHGDRLAKQTCLVLDGKPGAVMSRGQYADSHNADHHVLRNAGSNGCDPKPEPSLPLPPDQGDDAEHDYRRNRQADEQHRELESEAHQPLLRQLQIDVDDSVVVFGHAFAFPDPLDVISIAIGNDDHRYVVFAVSSQ